MALPVNMPDSRHRKLSYKIQAWNLSYRIHRRGDKSGSKQILRNVSCKARPGEILAVAGPSGAGKTTLLEILAGVVNLNQVSGRIKVNDKPMKVENFRRISGYVTQDDALFPLLTVKETLMYSARLKVAGGHQAAVVRVVQLLKDLGLEHVACSRIGGDMSGSRGVSGRERRRVSIGVDLVYLWRGKHTFAVARHKHHRSIFEEVDAIKRRKRYARPLIDLQMKIYLYEGMEPWSIMKKRPSDVPEGAVIIREHTTLNNLFSCLWFNEVYLLTPRDQLSFGHTREHSSVVEWVKSLDEFRKNSTGLKESRGGLGLWSPHPGDLDSVQLPTVKRTSPAG